MKWVLDQHEKKQVKDPTVAKKNRRIRFRGGKKYVIELPCRICTVSVETMKIIQEIEDENQ